jgi:hypothetical protein
MPIRLKAGQRPKYRMIHATMHSDGCFLMAENMQRRKDELFTSIQDGGQISLFDLDPNTTRNMDSEYITTSDIKMKVIEHLKRTTPDVRLRSFLADFVNEYGVLCEFKMLYDILSEIKAEGQIEIGRVPERTKTGRESAFWDDGKGDHKVTIRRVK